MASQQTGTTFVYVGTYTATARGAPHREHGIYVYRMDPATGALTLAHSVGGLVNPSFLALDPTQRHLYAVNEVDDVAGRRGGAVSAFAIDPATGALEHLNSQSTLGTGPCHLSVERSGRFVLVANYSGTPEELRRKLGLRGGRVFTVNALRIATETLGRPITNTPMIGALLRAVPAVELDNVVDELGEKFAGAVAGNNVSAVKRAYEEVASE